ncbi:hypothetical protein KC19_VG056700 [Ceratodon purpureus]|uniref:Endonuclease/exonuclease/phosphatase domain-containing protein n=1 Tax=Ceratodon purpureus TaxID=3225 RepID=A0A8T0HMB0_CERPU|nr:hypothetical protein KC19_VG056700 [Ceratodon purpureus]
MNIQNLTIASYNVSTLGHDIHGVNKRNEIKDFFDKANPQASIILLQEHHLPLEDCLENTRQLDYKGGASFWNHAVYNALGDRFKGGTAIIVGAKLTPFILDNGVLVESRVQYIVFDLGEGLKIGILNVYAHNHTVARQRLWSKLRLCKFPEACWILAGDLNMTENAEDRSPDYTGKAMGDRERGAWFNFSVELGINDVFYLDEFRRIGVKRHTWKREKPTPIWSRLDCFYVDGVLQQYGGRHGIWQKMDHISDHSAIFLQIYLEKRRFKGSVPFNNSILKDATSKEELLGIWSDLTKDQSSSYSDRFVSALSRIKEENDLITKKET